MELNLCDLLWGEKHETNSSRGAIYSILDHILQNREGHQKARKVWETVTKRAEEIMTAKCNSILEGILEQKKDIR